MVHVPRSLRAFPGVSGWARQLMSEFPHQLPWRPPSHLKQSRASETPSSLVCGSLGKGLTLDQGVLRHGAAAEGSHQEGNTVGLHVA